MKADREALNLRSFLEPDAPTLDAGLQLRPFSAGTLALLRQIKSPFLAGVDPEQMENKEFATLAFIYIQSAPLSEVRRVVWNEQLFRESVLAFSETITPTQLADAIHVITGAFSAAAAAQVEIKPKPQPPGGPQPPPNS